MELPRRQILFVLANGGSGGMQAQVRLVASELASRGNAVTVAVGGGGFAPLEAVRVVALPPFGRQTVWAFLRELRRTVRTVRPDIVHGHGLRLAPWLAMSGGRKRVVTCHGLDPHKTARTARVVRLSHVTVISCGRGPQQLLARFGVQSEIIENAFVPASTSHTATEMRQRFALTPNVPLVLYPARFSEQKGHLQLIDALKTVRNQLKDESPEIVCCGEGPLFAEVQRAAERANERPLLRCWPHLDDAASWFGATDFFVLPSRWEGQPLVVLEALSQGLAVVTSTPVGTEDLITDHRNGRRVTTIEEMATVIIEWCTQPSQRPLDQVFTRQLLLRHALRAVVDDYDALYQKLCR